MTQHFPSLREKLNFDVRSCHIPIKAMKVEDLIEDHINDFVYSVFLEHFRQNISIAYYLSKIWDDDSDTESPSIEEGFKQAIRMGIIDDCYTAADIEDDDYDSAMELWDCLDLEGFPYKQLLAKFITKNKHTTLGKLVRLSRTLWEKEKIVWINAWGGSPPYSQMQEIISAYPEIKGCSSWYTQNELLAEKTSTSILHNPCATQSQKKTGYCLTKASLKDLEKRVAPYLKELSIRYKIKDGDSLKIKFIGDVQMPNFVESDLV